MTPTPDGSDVRELAQAARDLSERITQMDREGARRDAALARQAQVTRRLLWSSWVALGAVVAALIVGVVALVAVTHTAHRLDTSTTVSRQRALCPLYQVLISADTPRARARAADPSAYDRAYVVIRQGYAALDCNQFKGTAPKLG